MPLRDRPAAAAVCLALAAAVVAIYFQVRTFAFLSWDDSLYFSNSGLARLGLSWTGVRASLRGELGSYWQPLTCLTHQAAWELFGDWAGGHHLLNVALFAVVVILMFAVWRRLTGSLWTAALAAMLFAVHPLRVESVAWVTERKDLLFGLFWLLAIWAYAGYVERPSPYRYAAVAGAFALSLLSKPAAVTLPVLLLLLDYWPLRRPWTMRLIWEKAPLAVLAAAVCGLTIFTEPPGGMEALLGRPAPAALRFANVAVNYAEYLRLTVWPAPLAYLYPYRFEIPVWRVLASVAVLAALSWAAWTQRTRRPWLPFGWLWFLVAILPNSGVVQSGYQSHADRFTFAAHMGLFLAVARSWPAGRIPVAAALAAAALLGAASWRYAAFWADSRVAAARAIAVTPENPIAWKSLAVAHMSDGLVDHVRRAMETSISQNPNIPSVRLDYGHYLHRIGEYGQALEQYEAALRHWPGHAETTYRIALALSASGRPGEAEPLLRRALDRGLISLTQRATAQLALGVIREAAGDSQDALTWLRAAVATTPRWNESRIALAFALARAGRLPEGERVLREGPADDASLRDALERIRREFPPAP